MDFKVNVLVFLFICIGSHVYSQEGNYSINIFCDAEEKSAIGFPFSFSSGVVQFRSLTIDTTIFLKDNNNCELIIKKKGNVLKFEYLNGKDRIEGELTIPKCRLSQYITELDPETFDYVLKIEEFYIPYRTGIWKFNIKGKYQEKKQTTRLGTNFCKE